ncbi:hypothetical protein LSAT2_031803 [Lamellibrachia satsuma]|nr:hypothetical protein LSAT2_031803 [Lamellibrachia satsuma]
MFIHRLDENPDLHDTAVMTALNFSLKKLTKLELLHMSGCKLNDDDIIALSEALPSLKQLEELMFHCNSIGDSGSKRLAEVAVALPCFRQLWLWGNCLTEQGVENVRQVERVESDTRGPLRSVWLVWLDWQRLPEQELNPSNPVVFWEHRETQQHSALNRLLRRDKKEQDKCWDTDVKYLKGALQKSRTSTRRSSKTLCPRAINKTSQPFWTLCQHAVKKTSQPFWTYCQHAVNKTSQPFWTLCQHAVNKTSLPFWTLCQHAVNKTSQPFWMFCQHAVDKTS